MENTGREAYCGRQWARAWVAEPGDIFVNTYEDDSAHAHRVVWELTPAATHNFEHPPPEAFEKLGRASLVLRRMPAEAFTAFQPQSPYKKAKVR